MIKTLLLAVATFSTAASAQPLTIHMGESWAFAVQHGQPVHAHRVKSSAKPEHGEIKATVTALAGTSMTLTNNSGTGYSYKAQLIGASGKTSSRTCTLPPTAEPVLEYWPHKSTAVRLGNFQVAKGAGTCPQNR
ncbi:MAG TPA: hypothetical protein VFI88_05645 [Sphingomicrobium sp.]|jgi:hypothetical protein|nr:hypothetical protein [Sphingomicrobium sp.]